MKRYLLKGIFCGLLLMGTDFADAKSRLDSKYGTKQGQMLNDLDFIHNLFHVTYAPLQWKEVHFRFDLNSQISGIESIIRNNRSLTTKQFQRHIKDFCNAVGDYHVVAEFYSTELAMLPFCIQGAEGKYFVSYIADPDLLPLSVGDEIVSFGDMPTAEAVAAFRSREVGNSFYGTDNALAEGYMTTRFGCLGHDVPQGPITLVVRPLGKNKPVTYEFEWDHFPELVSNVPQTYMMRSVKQGKKKAVKDHPYFHKQFATPHYKVMKRVRASENHPSVIMGAKKSMLPPLGKILWQTTEENEFYAYLFALPEGKTGGYVRIPTYHCEENSAEVFLEIVQKFEAEADLLVVDQWNNPGGSILYLYAILSILTDRPLEVPMHRVKITQQDAFLAATEIPNLRLAKDIADVMELTGESMDGMTVDLALAKSLLNSFCFILDQWDSGKQFTDFHYLYGIERIMPHPKGSFTKPMLVLVNSMAFSGGDFFPAILQDNNRAKIMGTRTAGAGGYIEKITFPNLSGISEIDFTVSYSERPGHRPIENYGVTPDIYCEVTQADLQDNYVDYVARILDELSRL